jgi:S1-C subfamily serine protease
MSTYDPSYDRYEPATRPVASVWPVLFLLAALTVLLGGLVYWFWGSHHTAPVAEPRPITPAGKLSDAEDATIQLFKNAAPSVVHVTNLTERRTPFSLNVQQDERGLGSGFVWDSDGHIVTNYHVVHGANLARVVFHDGSSYDTREIATYPDKDIAVLHINAPKAKLVPILVGSSHDLQVGQSTFAIGNPFGLDQSLTTGIVSALGREITSPNERPIRGVIQTSAPINPGNSGGPLLDSSGRLIGMTTAILSQSGMFGGIGFAIPVDEINQDVPQLISHGQVVRPRLGVQIAEDQVARQFGIKDGAMLIRVLPSSPAEAAGLRGVREDDQGQMVVGDVIVAIDDKPIKSGKDLFGDLEQYKPGDTVTVSYLRDGKRQQTKATLEVTE